MGKKYNDKKYKYLVNLSWSEEDQVYIADVPELKTCATHGSSPEKAIKNVSSAIESWIEAAKDSGIDIPEPIAEQSFSGKFMTRIPSELHKKLFIKAKQNGKSLNKIVFEILDNALAH